MKGRWCAAAIKRARRCAEESGADFCAGRVKRKIREKNKKALTSFPRTRKFAARKGGDNHHGNEESRREEVDQEVDRQEDDQEEVSASDRASRTHVAPT